ncbi:MAG: PhoH family protein [Rubrivivax sp.]
MIREHRFDTPDAPADNRRLARVCGPLDAHLRSIESKLSVRLVRHDASFRIEGARESVGTAAKLLDGLYAQAADHEIDERLLQMEVLRLAGPLRNGASAAAAPVPDADTPVVLHTRHADLIARTPNQDRYLRQMLGHDISFGIGPAGTGKTFLAVASAVDALERQGVQRIVLTRPAVEAGERLGFLPGDLAQKVDPYLRPLLDALHELMGPDRVAKAFEKQLIEIAPLAFMRGRTLSHAFVILDEAQNTTREQMKMFLTRIGFGSRCVVTGDTTQIDLPSGVVSGLIDAEAVLQGVPGIGFTRFDASDVVRHPLVARIVEAYDRARGDARVAAPAGAPARR